MFRSRSILLVTFTTRSLHRHSSAIRSAGGMPPKRWQGVARIPKLAEGELDEVADGLVEAKERDPVQDPIATRPGPADDFRIVSGPGTTLMRRGSVGR